MKWSIPAVIFAGGKSSRMGSDKALLPFGKASSLIDYQYEKLSHCFETVYLSTKEARTQKHLPLLMDHYSVYSPLAGLVSVFEQIEVDEIFVLSVDTPFVDQSVIAQIMKTTESFDACIARNKGEVQPLCGRYSRTILPLAKHALAQNHHKMQLFLRSAHTCYVDFDEEKAFMNLNRPQEYEAALRLLGKA